MARGLEAALGAALADDLRAPELAAGAAAGSGWAMLPAYGAAQPLPEGVEPLARHVEAPSVLARRVGQIGLVARADGARLQPLLKPGQRLVSAEGDLWRWDGLRAAAEDAPSAAALRLRQLNRLVELKRDLEEVAARAAGAGQAHELLTRRLAEATTADQAAREARREADRRMAEASRALSRAEADRSIAGGKLESARLAVARHAEEAAEARARLTEAEAVAGALPDLAEARAGVEDLRQAVEAARIAMLTRRSAHDEIRREGEARLRRRQEIVKEVSGWRHRLETAEKRIAELAARRGDSEAELAAASAAPGEIAAKRDETGCRDRHRRGAPRRRRRRAVLGRNRAARRDGGRTRGRTRRLGGARGPRPRRGPRRGGEECA